MTSKRRSISLRAARADGWFERLGEGSPDFGALSEAIGEQFLAFAFIAGVRVTALTLDRRSPDATLVDFVVGDDKTEQRLALGEFRRRLVSALLSPDDPPLEDDELQGQVDVRAVHGVIGTRYVLLAPVFGVQLVELRVGNGRPPTIVLTLQSRREELDLSVFREMIRERVRAELRRFRTESPFSIDLAGLPDAEEALERGDHDTTIELLGAWPGPLSMLLRTPEGQQLSTEVRSTLAHALGVLGSAYVRAGRFEWAEEVVRLGIQWGQDGPAVGDLYRRLGEAYVEHGRHAEAIGLLRRAAVLGEHDKVVSFLARCFLARKRYVAAAACAQEALEKGMDTETMQAVRQRAVEALGDSWIRFERWVTEARGFSDEGGQ